MTTYPDLYLASQSSRRAQLLRQIGVRFKVVQISVPEQRQDAEIAEDYVMRLAREKSLAGAAGHPAHAVLGADTIVVLDRQIFEKPKNKADAMTMLAQLSGKTHRVITSVAITCKGQTFSRLNTTSVTFREIAGAEGARYWLTGEPIDKAGAYGIQGMGAVFVESIAGSYSAVVGLPLQETAELLRQFEIPIWQGAAIEKE